MKMYSFIVAVAVCVLLTSCSIDDQETTIKRTFDFQQPEDYTLNIKEGDSIVDGEPIPPKDKDE